MKQLLELLPIILFFVVYQMDGELITLGAWQHQVDGIFTATAVLIGATLVQMLVVWMIYRQVEKRLIWTSAAVVVFGGATLLLRDELFIQWKPTVLNWGLAIAFAASQMLSERNLLERMMGSQLQLPRQAWTRLCWIWVAHFSTVGLLNILVAYNFEEATWVSYKLYSSIGFTLFIMLVTVLVISPWLKPEDNKQQTAETEFRP